MQEHPELQKKAQAELDAVVGRQRLPSHDDRESLPYVNALCKELLRYDPPFPVGRFSRLCSIYWNPGLFKRSSGVPHLSTDDDIHDGYFIPQGSVIIPSVKLGTCFLQHVEKLC
jgi:hypothetical protein